MRIESIRVKNFLSHADTTVTLDDDPLWLIVGHNGAGKSALFDAVEFALYGTHRGGGQTFEHLIKNNYDEAEIEVIFHHGGQRYRATRKLGRPKKTRGSANVGGSLYVRQNGKWQPIEEIGRGKRDVWGFVRENIMSHELFTSAVYLKQGAVDFFLSGNANDRGRRFASLMNLEEYTRLARTAQARAEEEEHTAEVRARDLEGLGDVSAEALHQLDNQLTSLDEEMKRLRGRLEGLRQKEGNARLWFDRTAQIERLDVEAEALRGLIDQADEIRAAAELVQGWDIVTGDLQRFWDNRDRAEECRRAAQQAESAAIEQESLAKSKEQEQSEAQGRLDKLRDELSTVRRAVTDAKRKLDAAKLEQDIAAQVSILKKDRERLQELTGAEEAHAQWEAQKSALPYLRAVVEAKAKLEELRAQLDGAQVKKDELQEAETESQKALDLAQVAFRDVQTNYEKVQKQVEELKRQIGTLEGEIKEHERLTGEEGICPVCNRELDEAAHAHVQKAVQEKEADLAVRRAALKETQAEAECLQQEMARAKAERDRADQSLQQARQRMQRKEGEIRTLNARIGDAQTTCERAIENAVAEAPAYANQAAEFDRPQLDALEAEVKVKRQSVKADLDAFQSAQREQREAQAQLKALRGQRDECVTEGPGDEGDVEALARRVAALEEERIELGEKLGQLKQQEQGLAGKVQQHIMDTFAAKASAAQLRRQAQEHKAAADKADGVADSIAVPEDWQGCLADREVHQARQLEVQRLRPIAAKVGQLNKAEGELKANREQREQLDTERQTVPPEHRIEMSKVQADLAVAESEQERLSKRRDQILEERARLRERRRQAKEYRAQEQKARQRAKIFDQLARLLGPGGDIQLRVVASIQEEVRRQANRILKQINDGLEIRLSEPRRSGAAALDVVVFDRRDPASGERHYEFLSGGETIRVGLAVALAIHWYATGRSPGTVIIDEGFGALDAERRLAVAQQIADVSDGLLRQNLVEQIVVITHAEEVKDYFPRRWEVEKRDGRAVVRETQPG